MQHQTTPRYQCQPLLPPDPPPAPFLPTPCSLLRPGPPASTSSAWPSMAWALLAQSQAWASAADAIHQHSKALCHVDFRAVRQRNPRWPCQGLTEVIHALSSGSRRLQKTAPWHAFCWGWGAGYGAKFPLSSAHSVSPSLLKLLIKPTCRSHVR